MAVAGKVPTKKKAVGKSAGKSGMRVLKPSEVLFNDGDKANSLYIIQKGQLRLFKPKGKGFIEIAVLRSGEVIGEMAYFDDDGGGKRSCSAAAMVSTEVIEISFPAFAKTMSGLNPWFKTIINTLANRLRQTNARVKELESNSASVSYSGKHTGYEFFKTNDVIKILGSLFLIYKAHGEQHNEGVALHRKTIDLYCKDIYMLMEAKLDSMLIILEELGIIKNENDESGSPKLSICKDLDRLRSIFIFYNTEKHLPEEKKLKIDERCEMFLNKIWGRIAATPNTDSAFTLVPVSDFIEQFKQEGTIITVETLEPARAHGMVGEVMVGNNNELSVEANYTKIQKLLPMIKFINKVSGSNKDQNSFA